MSMYIDPNLLKVLVIEEVKVGAIRWKSNCLSSSPGWSQDLCWRPGRTYPCLTVQEVKHKRISSITAIIILIVNNIFNNDIIAWILPINCDVIYPTRSASSNISLSLIIFRHWQVPEGSRQLDFQLTTRTLLENFYCGELSVEQYRLMTVFANLVLYESCITVGGVYF